MPRPIRRRNVCSLPEFNQFGPLGACRWDQNDNIRMTVEEYETIRLIDLESLTQEECAEHMNVARTTVQAIYAEARSKIAQALIHGKSLIIEGGNYQVCDGTHLYCHRGHCQNRRNDLPMWVGREEEGKK